MAQEYGEVLIGSIGVDAGCVVVGDPCYLVQQQGVTWEGIVDQMFDSNGRVLIGPSDTTALEIHGTIITGTPCGDGEFPVYAMVEGKQIVSIRIDMREEKDDE